MVKATYIRIRDGRPELVRPFSDAEDRLTTNLRIAGHGPTEIARRVNARFHRGRSPATISMKLKADAVREEGE